MRGLRRFSIAIAAAAGACAAGLLGSADAPATYPGVNAEIGFDCDDRLCMVRPDGSERKRLPASIGTGMAWSPDGRRIAADTADLTLADPDGSGLHVVPRAPKGATTPTWSPEGRRLAVSASSGESSDIFVLGEARDPRNLTERLGSGRDESPSWSPDGTRIAFTSDRQDGRSEIYVVNVDGTGLVRLTHSGAGGSSDEPDWSPDGTRIAFSRTRPIDEDTGTARDLFVMNADGSGERALTGNFDARRQALEDGSAAPSWAPDGSRIAFSDHDRTLKAIGADGSGETTLAADGSSPSWRAVPGTGPKKGPGPQLTGVKYTKRVTTIPLGSRRFKRSDGMRLRFRLDRAAVVVVRFEQPLRGVRRNGTCRKGSRGRPRCTYWQSSVVAALRGKAGTTSVRLTGQGAGGQLFPISPYRLHLIALDGLAEPAAEVRRSFRIVQHCTTRRRSPCISG